MAAQLPSRPVQIALLGAGIFARDAYLPILKASEAEIALRFVWSRSQGSAEALAAAWVAAGGAARGAAVEAVWGEEGLARIERSEEVEACVLVLPVQVQPALVLRLLKAGKHVMQEKPIAADYPQALALHAEASLLSAPLSAASSARPSSPQGPLWAVGENFRLEPAFDQAREIISHLGTMLAVQVVAETSLTPANKYFPSQWRRDPDFTGAFITDCGVHYVAAMCHMTGRRVWSVAAFGSHQIADVPPPDNFAATLKFEDGSVGTLSISFSYTPRNHMVWRVVCVGGTVEVRRGPHSSGDGRFGYTVSLDLPPGASLPPSCPSPSFHSLLGIQQELSLFAAAVAACRDQGTHTQGEAGNQEDHTSQGIASPPVSLDPRLSPLAALGDLAIMHAAVQSANSPVAAGTPQPVPVVPV
ncbi:hypothetical protein CLOM_g19551 [Closterium sp. NIES-68]|nr:hypothetical protein CLOM_g19551 [Closterium sp. NIES-68]